MLDSVPSLSAALEELRGTSLAKPWYPDCIKDTQSSSSPIAMPGGPPSSLPQQGFNKRGPPLETCRQPHPQQHHSVPPAKRRQRPKVLLPAQHAQHSAAWNGMQPRPTDGPPPLLPQQPQPQLQRGQPMLGRLGQAGQAALAQDAGQMLFLGTGCAEPSRYRGSSGVHLRLRNGRGALIDAGEGVHGQLLRHYGPALAQQQVRLLSSTGRESQAVFKSSMLGFA